MSERPLSPHLTVYRWGYTMTLSILHRMAGVALALVLIGWVGWLLAAAAGPRDYQQAMLLVHAWPVRLLTAAALLALCFHLCNGLRHLAWDAGFGFERAQARRSARLVILTAALAAIGCLIALWRVAGGA